MSLNRQAFRVSMISQLHLKIAQALMRPAVIRDATLKTREKGPETNTKTIGVFG